MRTNVMLCVASALIGAALSVALWNQPHAIVQFAAAEPPPLPGPDLAPGPRVEPAEVPGNAPVPLAVRGRATVEDDLTPDERINVAVYDNVNRSVVNIVTKIPGSAGFLMFDNSQEGAGSGSVLDKRGNILTNYHVIEGANEIEVTLFDGSPHEARVVGRDISSDVAVLHIDAPAESLFPVHFGDSTHLRVGQRVFAIGNPFGLERTLTTGIISSLNRTLPSRNNRSIKSVIQTDAAINPGNSGGPLLDSHGRLIGMNTAIASRTGQNTGVGFAIPVSIIGRVAIQLIDNPLHKVIRPETGILKVYQPETGRGLYIATMVPGGPAEQAGLRGFKLVKERKRQGPFTWESTTVDRSAADMIVGVDGQKTLNADDFLDAIESRRPGDVVQLHVIRDNREIIVPLRLSAAD
jgi:S1-C subfamily serine protease